MKDAEDSVHPKTPKEIAGDKLNNILTGIALKSGLLSSRATEPQLQADLLELEKLAIEAVSLARQITGP